MALKHGKLLDPRTDLVFKKIFGENKDLVKSFLNNILPLPADGLIDTLEYLSSEQVPITPMKKYSVVDVRCMDQKGRQFIVEMQVGWSESFKKRLQFGASKAYVSQLEKGGAYQLLQPVYGLGLIGERFNAHEDIWYHHYQTVNVADTKDTIAGLELIFVELPKFKPTTFWEKRLGVLWLRFLNEISTMGEIPHEFTSVPEISKAIEITQEASFTKEELALYDGFWDQVSIEKTIKHDAFEEGKVEGIAVGKAEGIAEERCAIALNLLKLGVADDVIIKASGLTLQELQDLKKNIA